jgi:uncharacterized protein with PhoU and TrkA domain
MKSEQRLKSIEDMLVEMKNTSELMVDLAYSALLFNSKEIAEELSNLEKFFDKLHVDFELAVLNIKDELINPQTKLGLIRIGVASENIADAAAYIADIVLRGIEPHPVLKLVFEQAEETITRVCLNKDSPLVNKTIGKAALDDKIGMRIIAVRRGKKWYYNPPDSFKLKEKDTLIARGFIQGREELSRLAKEGVCESE